MGQIENHCAACGKVIPPELEYCKECAKSELEPCPTCGNVICDCEVGGRG